MKKIGILILFVLSVSMTYAQHKSSFLIAFEAKGDVKSVIMNNGGIQQIAAFSFGGELTSIQDEYGEISFTRDDRSVSITGRDPDAIKYYFDYNNDRISRTEGSTGMYNYKDQYIYGSDGELVQIRRSYYDGFTLSETKDLEVKVLKRDAMGNWTERRVGEKVEKRTVTYYEEDSSVTGGEKYKSEYNRLNKRCKVVGGPGIVQFVKAVDITCDPEEYNCDKKNGYFSMFEEGAGRYICNAAYWNRKDGKKLFIVAYDVSDFIVDGNDTKTYGNSWSYSKVEVEPETKSKMRVEIGFKAYLYDPATKELVPMKQIPINNWPQKPGYRYLKLPQTGKNITVVENGLWGKGTEHVLKWNGMTFDY